LWGDTPAEQRGDRCLSIYAITFGRQISLATPNYKQQKKQREEQARKKKDEKEQRKAEKKGSVLPTPNA
jgi:F0F1-type ATP synthase epsilon subunit